MTKYLVTNIVFTRKDGLQFSGTERFYDFDLPADVQDIQAWLHDYDYTAVSDKTAYAVWLRSVMFYNYKLTYDFTIIDSTVNSSKAFAVNQLFLADLADMQYERTLKSVVDVTVPQLFIADLTADDLRYADEDVEQAIFEHMLNNLGIEVNVRTVTDIVLETIGDYAAELNAGCPDTIANAVCELLTEQLTDQKLNELYDAIHQLTSVLVKDVGKYL